MVMGCPMIGLLEINGDVVFGMELGPETSENQMAMWTMRYFHALDGRTPIGAVIMAGGNQYRVTENERGRIRVDRDRR